MSYIQPEKKDSSFTLLEAVTAAKFECKVAVAILLFKFISEKFIYHLFDK